MRLSRYDTGEMMLDPHSGDVSDSDVSDTDVYDEEER